MHDMDMDREDSNRTERITIAIFYPGLSTVTPGFTRFTCCN